MIFERVFVLSLLLAFEVSVLAAQPTYILSFSQVSTVVTVFRAHGSALD